MNELSGRLVGKYSRVDIASRLADFIFACLDVSEGTRREYKYRVIPFVQFARASELNKSVYLEYKRHLSSRKDLSVSTKNKYLIVARIFCKEMYRHGYTPTDYTVHVKQFKQSQKHKRDGFTAEEIQKILSFMQIQSESCDTCRKKALLSLLILQGLRQIEVVRLQVADIDFVSATALIQGKGEDDKELIYLHPTTVKVLKDYLKTCHIADGPLFTSNSNNKRIKQGLTTRSVRNILLPILYTLGIEKTVHGFRHYFTTSLIKAYKGDLLTVARYTRHKSLEMLQVYNDNLKHKDDLPRYYETFNGVNFDDKQVLNFP